MSYAVYTTSGFILGSAPTGEASKIYWIYTEDFGLIHAKAQGVRLLQSKLRFNLEEYSYARFSLVKGREIWRITGSDGKVVPETHKAIQARVLSLVRRLIQGEEGNKKLFDVLRFMRDEISKGEMADPPSFESLILVHALSALGYMDAKKILGEEILSLKLLQTIKGKRREIVGEINRALKETQL